MRTSCIIALVMLIGSLASPALAEEIIPASYIAPPGEVGWYTYYDDTGSQLTDGLHGLPWANEPGWVGDDPYPWVAWDSHPVSITYLFQQDSTIARVELFTGRAVSPSIYIPRTVQVFARADSGSWLLVAQQSYNDSTYADNSRHTLVLQFMPIRTAAMRIDLTPTARWIFLDEVDFHADLIPEPPSLLALVSGLGALGGVARRRRR